MALIGPFRRLLVYPSLVRTVRAKWSQSAPPDKRYLLGSVTNRWGDAYSKGKGAESEEAQKHANNRRLTLYA